MVSFYDNQFLSRVSDDYFHKSKHKTLSIGGEGTSYEII
jgi:hypothetical protein